MAKTPRIIKPNSYDKTAQQWNGHNESLLQMWDDRGLVMIISSNLYGRGLQNTVSEAELKSFALTFPEHTERIKEMIEELNAPIQMATATEVCIF